MVKATFSPSVVTKMFNYSVKLKVFMYLVDDDSRCWIAGYENIRGHKSESLIIK